MSNLTAVESQETTPSEAGMALDVPVRPLEPQRMTSSGGLGFTLQERVLLDGFLNRLRCLHSAIYGRGGR